MCGINIFKNDKGASCKCNTTTLRLEKIVYVFNYVSSEINFRKNTVSMRYVCDKFYCRPNVVPRNHRSTEIVLCQNTIPSYTHIMKIRFRRNNFPLKYVSIRICFLKKCCSTKMSWKIRFQTRHFQPYTHPRQVRPVNCEPESPPTYYKQCCAKITSKLSR